MGEHGKLTVLNKGPRKWLCLCDCGKEKLIYKYDVLRGTTKSCGCLQKQAVRDLNFKHGMSGFCREYNIWVTMRQRCLNPNNDDYKDYGGRGITICERWNDYQNFINDMGKSPTNKHSIDRIDNEGNYEPSNCKWSTNKYQCNHTRKNVILNYNGISKTLAQWSEDLKIGYSTLHARYYRLKWPIDKIITTPV
jgi:hypothetical protein